MLKVFGVPIPQPFRHRSFCLATLAVLALGALWFGGLEYRGLFKPDEGRYADIPRAMLQSGDWATPRLNGIKYFEKPPLQYWTTATMYAVFGPDEWTARLWPALTGFAGIWFLAFTATRFSGRASWVATAAITASSAGYFVASQILTLDMGLTLFVTVAVLAVALANAPGTDRRAERWWMLLGWAASALAVLSKGLIGIVIPAMAVVSYVIVHRDWSMLRRLRWVSGGTLLLAIAVPWFWIVQARNPEFAHFFFVHEQIERYALPQQHLGPWWYFVPVLFVGLAPWTLAVPAILRRAWTEDLGPFRFDRYLIITSAVIVLFFSASHSKLPAYVLPALPPLLLVVARHVGDVDARIQRLPAIGAVVAGILLMALARLLPVLPIGHGLDTLVDRYVPWLVASAVIWCCAGAGGLVLLRRGHVTASIVLLSLLSITALQVAISGTHKVDEFYSAEKISETVVGEHKQFSREPPFYSVGTYDSTVPFYLGRSLTLVSNRGELGPGLASQPGKYIPSLGEFLRRWDQEPGAYAIMNVELFQRLRAEGVPMRVVAQDLQRVIVVRP